MINPESYEIGEKCAVVGISASGVDVARATFFALQALQHRGQESSGIASSDGTRVNVRKRMGLLVDAIHEEDIRALTGEVAIGHNRYATSGTSTIEGSQPFVSEASVALAHNGNLPSTEALRSFLSERGINSRGISDSAMMTEAVSWYTRNGDKLAAALLKCTPLFTGAYSLVAMMGDELAAMRDPHGIRPLVIGNFAGGWVFASETCALDTIGAKFNREVLPGELALIKNGEFYSTQFAEPTPHLDAFEFIYFSRPDSTLAGKSVYTVREKTGYILAKESPVDADIVIPVPESAIPAAIGYARGSGVPYSEALARNRFAGRTFIQPGQLSRELGVDMKLNAMTEVLKGKRVVVVDDSIVRGTNSRKIVTLLREAGAKEVHFRVASPPIRYPDYYGIDLPEQSKLAAFGKTVEDINKDIGSTSLGYLSVRGLVAAIGLSEDELNLACFTGVYPLDIKERAGSVIGLRASGENRTLALV